MVRTDMLFDKIIDIELVDRHGRITKIVCPRSGMKPDITISGNFYGNIIQNGTLKIVNYYPTIPLNADNQAGAVYEWLRVSAGYASGEIGVTEGQSFLAYTEEPGPDGVSVITFFTGPMDVWLNTPINKSWDPGVSMNTVLKDVCDMLKKYTSLQIAPRSYIADSLKVGKAGLRISGACSSLQKALREAYGLSMYPEGLNMILCDRYLGKTETYRLNYITSIRKTAAGYTIIAPWLPRLRQNDKLIIDAKYYAVENYGAIGVSFDTTFTVISVAFEFSTVQDKNSMTVLCVGKKVVNDNARYVKPSGASE